MQHIDIIRAMLPHVDVARRVSGGDGDLAAMHARAALAKRDAMSADDKLIMDLATPDNVDAAIRLLRHPLESALEFCVARDADEFFRRLAGSIRKAYQSEIDAGRA